MGLDQYLYRVVDPGKPIPSDREVWADENGLYDQASQTFGPVNHKQDDHEPQSYAAFKRHLETFTNISEVAYWRKFNALHLWIERNCFDGQESNGDRIPVSLEQLAGLQVTCERVAADPSLGPDQLPTGSRFFFGSEEYDEWYVQDCAQTAVTLRKLIDEEVTFCMENRTSRPFFYNSSW